MEHGRNPIRDREKRGKKEERERERTKGECFERVLWIVFIFRLE